MTLSIITINYNNAYGLAQTVKSVSGQTFSDYEYIVIDGGSTDDSIDIIKANSDNISYWISEKDNGVYHAMNKGLAQAKGGYILMLNSGDVLASPDTLKTVFEQQAYTEDILYGNVTWLNNNVFYTESIFPDALAFQYFWYKSLGHQAAFIKKSVHDKAGLYDETFRICADWKLFVLAICKYGATYRHINDTVAVCDCTGMSWNSANAALMQAERRQVLQEQFPLFYNDYKELERYKHEESRNRFGEFTQAIKERIKLVTGYKKAVSE